jgi:LemA protein
MMIKSRRIYLQMTATTVTAIAAVAVIALGCFLFCWRTYSELVDREHFLDVAHGRLLLQMQRKHDLLTSSRNVVARYAAIEGQIQDHLIALHGLTKTPGPSPEMIRSEGLALVDLIRELDALIEAYPDLKSKGPYVLLMETIQETGLRVTTERLNCNTTTYNYNLLRQLFPSNVVARVFRFKERPFLMGPLQYAPVNRVS